MDGKREKCVLCGIWISIENKHMQNIADRPGV
jgi:hypothetical protein